jgi:hypothetical protein
MKWSWPLISTCLVVVRETRNILVLMIGGLTEILTQQLQSESLYGHLHAPSARRPTDEHRDYINKTGKHFLLYRVLMQRYGSRNYVDYP